MQTLQSSTYSMLLTFLLPMTSFANQSGSLPLHVAPPSVVQKIWQWNHSLFQSLSEEKESNDPVPYQPVPEYAHFRYLLMTNETGYDTDEFKQAITKNLPGDMKLVLLAGRGDEEEALEKFSQWISKDRLVIVSSDEVEDGFWARDSFPYPVYMEHEAKLGLVSAQYFVPFESGPAIASSVKAPIFKKSYSYVGGNLMADEDGRCFVVSSDRRYGLTEKDFKQNYGCHKVIFLKHESGIGDVDEVLKVLPNHQALTNTRSYVPVLEAEGYTVTMLPRLEGYRTYANSVILNGTVFMPAYHESTDEEAASVYQKFGYKVVMADSRTISDDGYGSFHCSTMAYPEIDENALVHSLSRGPAY